MQKPMQKIVPCLWYDGDAETAARRYAELDPGLRGRHRRRAIPTAGQELHGREAGLGDDRRASASATPRSWR